MDFYKGKTSYFLQKALRYGVLLTTVFGLFRLMRKMRKEERAVLQYCLLHTIVTHYLGALENKSRLRLSRSCPNLRLAAAAAPARPNTPALEYLKLTG